MQRFKISDSGHQNGSNKTDPQLSGYDLRRFFSDVLVDETDVPVYTESVSRESKCKYDPRIDKCHSEIAREEPSRNKAEQHYYTGEDKILKDVTYRDCQCQELIEKDVDDSDFELLKDNPEIDNVPPLDAMWAYCRNENIPEPEVTYWVCMSMIAACPQLGDESSYENNLFYVDLGDSEGLINT